MKKIVAAFVALTLSPGAAYAAMDCCKDSKCCCEKKDEKKEEHKDHKM